MALDLVQFKTDLKASLKGAAESNKALTGDDLDAMLDTAMQNLADAIATEVDKYIKTLTLTIATGLVQVEGTAVAQANVAPIVVDGGVS